MELINSTTSVGIDLLAVRQGCESRVAIVEADVAVRDSEIEARNTRILELTDALAAARNSLEVISQERDQVVARTVELDDQLSTERRNNESLSIPILSPEPMDVASVRRECDEKIPRVIQEQKKAREDCASELKRLTLAACEQNIAQF